MLVKKKHFLFAGLSALALIVGSLCFVLNKQSKFERATGNDESYVLELNRSLNASEVSAGVATFKTAKGNDIDFKFASASVDSGLVSLAAGGYFYNDTMITGISKIEATLTSGSATLSYGNAKDILMVGSAELSGTSLITVNLSAPSDYFRIEKITGSLAIASLRITYACENDYSYAAAREAASGDLFYTSNLEQSFSWAYVHDRKCLDVANYSSGYSFQLVVNSSASGWPTWNFDFGSPVGETTFDIEFYAKGVGHTDYNVMLLDGSNNNILNGNRAITVSESWQKITLSSLTVASGKSLADVQKLKMSANYGATAGVERHLYLDQLHLLIPETPTRNNLEMVEYTRASTTQTAAASLCFDDTYNPSSTASRKLDYATATGFGGQAASTYRAFATFNVESSLGSSNGIDAKSCNLDMYLKYSDVILNSEDTRINQFTLDITDCGGTSATAYIYFTVTDGWIHISKDLSTVGNIANLTNGNLRSIKFGFYGVYTGNQADAVIWVDNIAITAK